MCPHTDFRADAMYRREWVQHTPVGIRFLGPGAILDGARLIAVLASKSEPNHPEKAIERRRNDDMDERQRSWFAFGRRQGAETISPMLFGEYVTSRIN